MVSGKVMIAAFFAISIVAIAALLIACDVHAKSWNTVDGGGLSDRFAPELPLMEVTQDTGYIFVNVTLVRASPIKIEEWIL